MKSLMIMVFIYLMVLAMTAMPASAARPATNLAVGYASNFSLLGEYSPRKRCRDEAKHRWKICRERDRRPNDVCDEELSRRRLECDRLPG